jgi:ectoine hydroxylase-related dioxygenase (phytanoyl-CoA dioxygenase family)
MESVRQKIEDDGYIVLPNLISDAECDKYKEILENNYAKYSSHYVTAGNKSDHGLADKTLEKTVYNLHNKDFTFMRLFEHPEVLKILDFMLLEGSYKDQEPYYLYNNCARTPLKGNPGQQLHSDSRLPGINYCIVANVLWATEDFTPENGSTRIVPGSHKTKQFAEDGKIYDEEIRVNLKKGSALIFDANLWHGGGPNTNGESRWALTLGYARWFIKPAFDYMQNTPDEVYNKLNLSQKRLLGFDSFAPKDEFTRLRGRSVQPEAPYSYKLPK